MKSKWKTKLNSNTGESIAETLISLLIVSLGLLMLAGAISAASRSVQSSNEKMGEYYNANDSMVKQERSNGNSSVTISSKRGDFSLKDASYPIQYYQNTVLGDKKVTTYKYVK